MCWYSYSSIFNSPKTAECDIEVIKVVRKDNKTPFREYYVEYNKCLPKVNIVLQYENNRLFITNGYHSHSKNCLVKEDYRFFELNGFAYEKYCDIHKAYIPKGTKYYENEWGDFVSETLVIIEEDAPIAICQDLDVIIDDNGKLKLKRYKEKLNGSIVGIKIGSVDNNVYVLSMLDKDWLPVDFSNTNFQKNNFSKKYGGNCVFDLNYEDAVAYSYRLREIIKGSVNWNMPFWAAIGNHIFKMILLQINYSYADIEGQAIRLAINAIDKTLIDSNNPD